MRSRPGAVPVGLLLVLLASAGCSDDDGATDGGAGDPTSDPGDPPAALQLRPVTASEDRPSAELEGVDCDAASTAPADQPATGCDAQGGRYLLGPAELETVAEEAEEGLDASGSGPVVTVVLPDEASDRLAEISSTYAGTQQQVAIVVEGQVVSAPVFATPIEDGELQISGVSADEARALAEALG